jgi:hypothetical protein
MNDARLYRPGEPSQLPTGWSFPATTDDGAAPPDTARWLKILSTSSAYRVLIAEGDAITAKTYGWLSCRALRLRGALGVGESAGLVGVRVAVDGVLYIEWVRVSAATFNWRLTRTGARTVLATGTTAFDTDTSYATRLQLDGTTATLWVDGSQEIRVAYARRLSQAMLEVTRPPASGQQHYHSGILLCQSNAEADRPATDVQIATLVEDGDWATEQGYGDDANCNAGQTGAVAADIALASGVVVTPSYWCEHASEADRQMVELTSFTFTGGRDILGCTQRAACASNVLLKTVTTQGRIHDGTTAREASFPNLALTDFHCRNVHHPLPPDGGAWTQAKVNAMKGGVSSNAANGANDRWAGAIWEVAAVSPDPPGVVAGPPDRMRGRWP